MAPKQIGALPSIWACWVILGLRDRIAIRPFSNAVRHGDSSNAMACAYLWPINWMKPFKSASCSRLNTTIHVVNRVRLTLSHRTFACQRACYSMANPVVRDFNTSRARAATQSPSSQPFSVDIEPSRRHNTISQAQDSLARHNSLTSLSSLHRRINRSNTIREYHVSELNQPQRPQWEEPGAVR